MCEVNAFSENKGQKKKWYWTKLQEHQETWHTIPGYYRGFLRLDIKSIVTLHPPVSGFSFVHRSISFFFPLRSSRQYLWVRENGKLICIPLWYELIENCLDYFWDSNFKTEIVVKPQRRVGICGVVENLLYSSERNVIYGRARYRDWSYKKGRTCQSNQAELKQLRTV